MHTAIRRRGITVFSRRYWLGFTLDCALVLIFSLLFLSHSKARVPQSTGSAEPGQSSSAARLLEPGKLNEREIGSGQTHSYLVTLSAGQFLEAVVGQHRLNIGLTLYSPDGAKLLEIRSVTSHLAQVLVFLAEQPGLYRLDVRSTGSPGRYTLKIEPLKNGDDRDRRRISAQQALADVRLQGSAKVSDPGAVYERAQELARALGDRRAEGLTATYQGGADLGLGNYQKALDHFAEARLIWQTLGERQEEAELLEALARVHKNYFGDLEKSLATYDQALGIWREVGDQNCEAMLLFELASINSQLGEYQKALDVYYQSLALRRSMGDRFGESNTLNTIGGLYYTFGDYQRALDYYQQVLAMASEEGNLPQQAGLLNNIARTYELLGVKDKAVAYFDQSLERWRKTSFTAGEADQLNNIAAFYERQGDYQKALSYYQQTLTLRRQQPNQQKPIFTLLDMTNLRLKIGERQAALDNLKEAIATLPANIAPGSRATFLEGFGDAWTRLGETRQALDCYRQALLLLKPLRIPRAEASALYKIALTERELGDLAAARDHIESALEITESLRARISNENWRSSFFASVRQYYQLYIDLLMQAHKLNRETGLDAEGLRISELAHARNLVDLMKEARAEVRNGIDPKAVERQHALQQQLNLKAEQQTRLLTGNHTEEQAVRVAQEIRELTASYEEAQAQMRASNPRYAALMQPRPQTVNDIQQMLDPETMLLEYALGTKTSYLWAVTRDSVASFELPSRAEIEAEAKQVYQLLTAGNLRPKGETDEQRQTRLLQAETEYTAASARLSRMLLGPIAQSLGAKRIVVVADGALHYLPFAALPFPQTDKSSSNVWEPLMAKHEVVNLPSASVLGLLRSQTIGRSPAAKAVAVIADPVFERDDARVIVGRNKTQKQGIAQASSLRALAPNGTSSVASRRERDVERSAGEAGVIDNSGAGIPRLSFSRREADAIIAFAPSSSAMKAVDFQASISTATNLQLAQYRIVHFATHGLLNTQHPELSGVILSLVDEHGAPQNGFLRLNEIYNLNLPADLVVLSSCNSALGKEVRGEGLVGLTRGFMYAGATRVVASLWKVDDAATAEFMRIFYRKMLRDGLRPAAALQAAQVEMSGQKRWQSPYYWAAFVLQGEWR